MAISRAEMLPESKSRRRLRAPERRRQLLDVALAIVRDEGADALTLAHLAERAGVSKPVAYDHFATRSNLLVELYRWIDGERSRAFRTSMASRSRSIGEMAHELAVAYIDCAADTRSEFSAIGAALAGSEENAVVYQELLDDLVHMFADMLAPYSRLDRAELERRCVGLVGAGEALSSSVLRGRADGMTASAALAALIQGALKIDHLPTDDAATST